MRRLTFTRRSKTISGIIAGLCIPMMHSPFSTLANRLADMSILRQCKKKKGAGIQDKVWYDHHAVCPCEVSASGRRKEQHSTLTNHAKRVETVEFGLETWLLVARSYYVLVFG